jgi:hypothetical protein
MDLVRRAIKALRSFFRSPERIPKHEWDLVPFDFRIDRFASEETPLLSRQYTIRRRPSISSPKEIYHAKGKPRA